MPVGAADVRFVTRPGLSVTSLIGINIPTRVIIYKRRGFHIDTESFMRIDQNMCFFSIPSTDVLLGKLYGTGEKLDMLASVHLDTALNALQAGLSLDDLIEQAKRQVERDILEQILVATDYNISVAAQLLNLDERTMAAKIQVHFASPGLTRTT